MTVIYNLYRKIFARLLFRKFNIFLYNCALRGLGVWNYENLNISGEASFVKQYLKDFAKRKSEFIVFDVGANQGGYIDLILDNIKNAKCFAFEPHPKTFKRLQSNLADKAAVKTFNFALSSEAGKMKLYDYDSFDGSAHASLSADIFETVHNSKVVSHEVDVSTIDLFSQENNIDHIDFLKIDVEGYELDVLNGAIGLINSDKVDFIQFEVTQLNSTTRVFFKDFWDVLSKKYKIYRLLPTSMLSIRKYDPTMNEIFGYQNYVAMRKERVVDGI